MISLITAFQFLTTLPPVVRRSPTTRELGRAVGWYPLVGLTLGAGLYGLRLVTVRFLPPPVVAAAVLTAWIGLSGALHFDGLLDTCDGVFGGRTPEERMAIMRDSRVGAFGMAGGALLLLTKYAAFTVLPARATALFLAPSLGRWAMVLAMFGFPYGREQGLGRDIKDNLGRHDVILASGVALVGALLVGQAGLAALGITAASVLLLATYLTRRLPGLTGDTYGALCEVVEMVVLVIFTVR